MDGVLRSSARVSAACSATVAGVASVSVLAIPASVLLWFATSSLWLSAAAPSAVIAVAVAVSVMIQRRAARRHEALCAGLRQRP